MSISWGTKIVILYCSFVLLMTSLIIGANKQDFQLVSEDYYQQEIDYQQKLDAAENSATLAQPVAITAGTEKVLVHFPQSFAGVMKEMTLQFYAPSNAAADYTTTVKTSDNSVAIPRKKLQSIPYRAKLSWTAHGTTYYQEVDVNLLP